MTSDLRSLRARAAYWEKRLDLDPARAPALAKMAWAEMLRHAIRGAVGAYRNSPATLRDVIHHQVTVALRPSGSPRTPCRGANVPAVAPSRGRRTP